MNYNNKYSPRRRLSNAFYRNKKRCIATATPTSIVSVELMEKVGIYFPEANKKASLMAELASSGYEILGFDTIMPSFSVQYEAAALGCEINWGKIDRMPDAVTHPLKDKNMNNLIIPKNLLEKPSLKTVLDAISILRKEYGDKVPILGKVMGPWTLAYHLMGVQEFLIQTLLDVDFTKKLLDILKEVSISFCNAQFRAGADFVTLADHATGDLVSAQMYNDLLVPIHKEILQRVGGSLILHICGNCYDRLRYFVDAGFEAYHYEWQVDSQKAIERVNDEMTLIGNVSNKELYFGNPEVIYKQVHYTLDAGVSIIGPECAIPLRTPIRNLKAIVEAVKDYKNN